jgi:hypothetical protein
MSKAWEIIDFDYLTAQVNLPLSESITLFEYCNGD